MKKIPYKVRVLISILCFVTALEAMCAIGYIYAIGAPTVALVGTLITGAVCVIAGIVFIPTHKPDGTPIVVKQKPMPKTKPRHMVFTKPIKTPYEEPINEEDTEEEEEDEILAMEMLDDVLDD